MEEFLSKLKKYRDFSKGYTCPAEACVLHPEKLATYVEECALYDDASKNWEMFSSLEDRHYQYAEASVLHRTDRQVWQFHEEWIDWKDTAEFAYQRLYRKVGYVSQRKMTKRVYRTVDINFALKVVNHPESFNTVWLALHPVYETVESVLSIDARYLKNNPEDTCKKAERQRAMLRWGYYPIGRRSLEKAIRKGKGESVKANIDNVLVSKTQCAASLITKAVCKNIAKAIGNDAEMNLQLFATKASAPDMSHWAEFIEWMPELNHLKKKFHDNNLSEDDLNEIMEYVKDFDPVNIPKGIAAEELFTMFPRLSRKLMYGLRVRPHIQGLNIEAADAGKSCIKFIESTMDNGALADAGLYGNIEQGELINSVNSVENELVPFEKVLAGRMKLTSQDEDALRLMTGYVFMLVLPNSEHQLVGFSQETTDWRDAVTREKLDESIILGPDGMLARDKQAKLVILGVHSPSDYRGAALDLLVCEQDFDKSQVTVADLIGNAQRANERLTQVANECTCDTFDVMQDSYVADSNIRYKKEHKELRGVAAGPQSSILKDLGRMGQLVSGSVPTALLNSVALFNGDLSVMDLGGEVGKMCCSDGAIYLPVRTVKEMFLSGAFVGNNSISIDAFEAKAHILQMRWLTVKGASVTLDNREYGESIVYARTGGDKKLGTDRYEEAVGRPNGVLYVVAGGMTKAELEREQKRWGNVKVVVKDANKINMRKLSVEFAQKEDGKWHNWWLILGAKKPEDTAICVDRAAMKLIPDFGKVLNEGREIRLMEISEINKAEQVINIQFAQAFLDDAKFLQMMEEKAKSWVDDQVQRFVRGGKRALRHFQETYALVNIAELYGARSLDFGSQYYAWAGFVEAKMKRIDRLRFATVPGYYLMGTSDKANFFMMEVLHKGEVFVASNKHEFIKGGINAYIGRTPMSSKYGAYMCSIVGIDEIKRRIKEDLVCPQVIKDILMNFYTGLKKGTVVLPSADRDFYGLLDGPDFDGDHYFVIIDEDFVAMANGKEHIAISYDGNKDNNPIEIAFNAGLSAVARAAIVNDNQKVGVIANMGVSVNGALEMMNRYPATARMVVACMTKILARINFNKQQRAWYIQNVGKKASPIGKKYESVIPVGIKEVEITQETLDSIQNALMKAQMTHVAGKSDYDLCVSNWKKFLRDLVFAIGGSEGKIIDSAKTLATVKMEFERLLRVVRSMSVMSLECVAIKDMEYNSLDFELKIGGTMLSDWNFEVLAATVEKDGIGEDKLKDAYKALPLNTVEEAEVASRYIDRINAVVCRNSKRAPKPVHLTPIGIDTFCDMSNSDITNVLIGRKGEGGSSKVYVVDPIFVVKMKAARYLLQEVKKHVDDLLETDVALRFDEEVSLSQNAVFEDIQTISDNLEYQYYRMDGCREVGVWVPYFTGFLRCLAYQNGLSEDDLAIIVKNSSLFQAKAKRDGKTGGVVATHTGLANYYTRFGYETLLHSIVSRTARQTTMLEMGKNTPKFVQQLYGREECDTINGGYINFVNGKSLGGNYYVDEDNFTGFAKIARTGWADDEVTPEVEVAVPLETYCRRNIAEFGTTKDMPVLFQLPKKSMDYPEYVNAIKNAAYAKIVIDPDTSDITLVIRYKGVDEDGNVVAGSTEVNMLGLTDNTKVDLLYEMLNGKVIHDMRTFSVFEGESREVKALSLVGTVKIGRRCRNGINGQDGINETNMGLFGR